MKSRTVKVLLRTTANEVESLKCRMDAAEQKLQSLAIQQQSDLKSFQALEAYEDQSVNRADLMARDKEFLRKISIIKKTQDIIRATYEEQKIKRKPLWEKIIPRWVSFRNS